MHRIQATITALDAALKDAADANPVFLSTQEKAAAVLELGRIETRVEELRLRVLAVAQDVADEVGARDPGTWLVAQEIADSPAARRQLRLAQALEAHPVVRAGLAEGRFTIEHAQVIIQALEDLPNDLPADLPDDPSKNSRAGESADLPTGLPTGLSAGMVAGLVAKAEAHLCDLATRHRPGDLRRLARHLVDVVAPEVAEEAGARAIARMEAHAEAKATLSITPLGDGTSRLFALVPEAVGERLRTYLDSFAQPRITALETDGRTPP